MESPTWEIWSAGAGEFRSSRFRERDALPRAQPVECVLLTPPVLALLASPARLVVSSDGFFLFHSAAELTSYFAQTLAPKASSARRARHAPLDALHATRASPVQDAASTRQQRTSPSPRVRHPLLRSLKPKLTRVSRYSLQLLEWSMWFGIYIRHLRLQRWLDDCRQRNSVRCLRDGLLRFRRRRLPRRVFSRPN
jgi:hypothetical protein